MHKPISLRQGLNLIEQIELGPAFGRASKILMK